MKLLAGLVILIVSGSSHSSSCAGMSEWQSIIPVQVTGYEVDAATING
jgi:hypothetical protein